MGKKEILFKMIKLMIKWLLLSKGKFCGVCDNFNCICVIFGCFKINVGFFCWLKGGSVIELFGCWCWWLIWVRIGN